MALILTFMVAVAVPLLLIKMYLQNLMLLCKPDFESCQYQMPHLLFTRPPPSYVPPGLCTIWQMKEAKKHMSGDTVEIYASDVIGILNVAVIGYCY